MNHFVMLRHFHSVEKIQPHQVVYFPGKLAPKEKGEKGLLVF